MAMAAKPKRLKEEVELVAMRIDKDLQKEAGRVWNPKDSIFYTLIKHLPTFI